MRRKRQGTVLWQHLFSTSRSQRTGKSEQVWEKRRERERARKQEGKELLSWWEGGGSLGDPENRAQWGLSRQLQEAHHVAPGSVFRALFHPHSHPPLRHIAFVRLSYKAFFPPDLSVYLIYLCIIIDNPSRNKRSFQLLKHNKTYIEGLTQLEGPPI